MQLIETGTFDKEQRGAVHLPSIVGHLAGVSGRVARLHSLKLQRAASSIFLNEECPSRDDLFVFFKPPNGYRSCPSKGSSEGNGGAWNHVLAIWFLCERWRLWKPQDNVWFLLG